MILINNLGLRSSCPSTIFTVFILLISINSWASLKDHGLSLDFAKSPWIFFEEEDFSSKGHLLLAQTQVGAKSSSLTLKLDKSEIKNLKTYVQKWSKEYSKFGYEILGTTEVQFGDLTGYKLEITGHGGKKQKKSFQFLAKAKEGFFIFTCLGEWSPCQNLLESSQVAPAKSSL